ncbi:hypothetical protein M0Q97_07475 [Candidatus Dojkabacteria bacterium]|jgi:hypothetical protein|nr:hypothetical protein [Candidatus Dojkabacteria bacterium]
MEKLIKKEKRKNMKIVKLTNGNGDVVYKVKPSGFWSIFNIFGGCYWSDGTIGSIGQDFTLEEVKKFINSFKIKSEILNENEI